MGINTSNSDFKTPAKRQQEAKDTNTVLESERIGGTEALAVNVLEMARKLMFIWKAYMTVEAIDLSGKSCPVNT